MASDAVYCVFPHLLIENLSEQGSRLLEVRFRVPGSDLGHQSLHHIWLVTCFLVEFEGICSVVSGIRLVVRASADFGLNCHGSISDPVGELGFERAVDRELLEVGSESVSLGIRVGEEPSLKNAIGGRSHSWYEIARGKGSLLCLSKVIINIAIDDDPANLYERVVFLGDYFGGV